MVFVIKKDNFNWLKHVEIMITKSSDLLEKGDAFSLIKPPSFRNFFKTVESIIVIQKCVNEVWDTFPSHIWLLLSIFRLKLQTIFLLELTFRFCSLDLESNTILTFHNFNTSRCCHDGCSCFTQCCNPYTWQKCFFFHVTKKIKMQINKPNY